MSLSVHYSSSPTCHAGLSPPIEDTPACLGRSVAHLCFSLAKKPLGGALQKFLRGVTVSLQLQWTTRPVVLHLAQQPPLGRKIKARNVLASLQVDAK